MHHGVLSKSASAISNGAHLGNFFRAFSTRARNGALRREILFQRKIPVSKTNLRLLCDLPGREAAVRKAFHPRPIPRASPSLPALKSGKPPPRDWIFFQPGKE